MPDILLPDIKKLEITNFSLYCNGPVVMDFSKPVLTCPRFMYHGEF